ncbi:unnamed protein product [Durusdinium trenchii]|uniref:Uncharacterized protein n=1 Tax=Durusdinium trenchii TaxID=1381693 RepID=A0ABP0JXZ4_9DINO
MATAQLRPAAPRATRAAPRGLSVPQLKVRTSSCVYETAGQLTEHLKRDPEVQLEASGLKVAEKSLRILSLAGADLQKCTGYLPGFGALGLRLDHFRATTLSTPCELRARVARLLEPPLVSDSIVQVVTKKSSWPGLAEGILHQLDGGEAALEHFAECFRFVGAGPAELVLLAAQHVEKERPGLRLALCPSLGASLDHTGGFRYNEVLVLLCSWSNVASEAPGLPAIRPRHSAKFLEALEAE